jgi:hypothetical protein
MFQLDPMASKYGSLTPYNYSLNNPTNLNDPLGDDVEPQPMYPREYLCAMCWREGDSKALYMMVSGGGGFEGQWSTRQSGINSANSFWHNGVIDWKRELKADAEAVRNGKMGLEDYSEKHGSKGELWAVFYGTRTESGAEAEEFVGWRIRTLNGGLFWSSVGPFGAGTNFETLDKAAEDWGMMYNDNSIVLGREFASTLYENGFGYSYSVPRVGLMNSSIPSPAPLWAKAVGDIHSHSSFDHETNEYFSHKDVAEALERGPNWTSYITTPLGALYMYDASMGAGDKAGLVPFGYGKLDPISVLLPSDPSMGGARWNLNDARNGPKNEPTWGFLEVWRWLFGY